MTIPPLRVVLQDAELAARYPTGSFVRHAYWDDHAKKVVVTDGPAARVRNVGHGWIYAVSDSGPTVRYSPACCIPCAEDGSYELSGRNYDADGRPIDAAVGR